MDFAMFTYKSRTKYFFAITVVLIMITQSVGWAFKTTQELYNYDGCQFSLLRQTICPANFFPRCILPSLEDCDQALDIVTQFTFATVHPLLLIISLVLFTVIYYFFGCAIIGIIKSQQFLKFALYQIFIGYFISAAMYLIAGVNLIIFSQKKDLQLNSQITVASFSLGILHVVIAVLTIGAYYDFKGYFKYEAPSETIINFQGQLYYYPDRLIEQTVPDIQQNPIQEVQLQYVEIR